MLHRNNKPTQDAQSIRQLLAVKNFVVLEQNPNSPDVARWNSPFSQDQDSHHFEDLDDIGVAVTTKQDPGRVHHGAQ